MFHDTNCVIVSRHPATLEFIGLWLSTELVEFYIHRKPDGTPECMDFYGRADTAEAGTSHGSIPIINANARPEDVTGKVVYGNMPLSLACLAERVFAVEFDGTPPRGQEYTLADMKAAGARLQGYRVAKG